MTSAVKPQQHISSIWLRMAENIDGNFLEFFLITSQSAGLEKSMGRAFGVGKSTLAIWMAYRAFAYKEGYIEFVAEKQQDEEVVRIVDNASQQEREALMEKIITNYMRWHIRDLLEILKNAEKPLPAVIWDDVQRTAPAYQHIPSELRNQIEYLTMSRQKVRNLIMTAPAMSDIAKPLRRNITWELIVPVRGTYEVQFLSKHRDFYNPSQDRGRLWYEATGTFPPLPEKIDKLYNKLRLEFLNIC